MISKFWSGVFLFALLGLVLGAIGITISENPMSFFTILTVAILIDLNGKRS